MSLIILLLFYYILFVIFIIFLKISDYEAGELWLILLPLLCILGNIWSLLINFYTFCAFAAERRAQLARSRSRQNVLSPEPTTSVTREINFEPDCSVTPRIHQHLPNRADRRDGTLLQQNGETQSAFMNRLNKSNVPVSIHLESGNVWTPELSSKWMTSSSGLSEAEELLERLRRLWTLDVQIFFKQKLDFYVDISIDSHTELSSWLFSSLSIF